MGTALDAMLQAYGRLPIPTREEQVLLGRAIRAWLDWEPSALEQEQGVTEPPRRIRRAGERAREQLVARNMLLVAKQARSFSVSSMPALEIQDLIQEGAIGLCRAAELFDPTHGFAFSTFAVWWIRQSMTRLVHGGGAIRIPTKRSQAMHQLRRWVERFTASEGRAPTVAEQLGAGITGVRRPSDLVILREAAQCYRMASLDAGMTDDGDSWLSVVAAPATEQPTTSDREYDLVISTLQPWPVLQEVMARRLAGQAFAEISAAMGISKRMAAMRGRQARAMAQWRLQNPEDVDPEAEPKHPDLDEAESGELVIEESEQVQDSEPNSEPIFWQPTLELGLVN